MPKPLEYYVTQIVGALVLQTAASAQEADEAKEALALLKAAVETKATAKAKTSPTP